MRVTKIIREYVEKVVCEKMPIPEEPQEVTELRKEFEALTDELKAMCAKAYIEFFRKHKGECAPYYCDKDLDDIDSIVKYLNNNAYANCGSNTITIAAVSAHKKAKDEVIKKRKATTEEILVTLELGGNKADLDAMLANL